jgi:hypothetical protein
MRLEFSDAFYSPVTKRINLYQHQPQPPVQSTDTVIKRRLFSELHA